MHFCFAHTLPRPLSQFVIYHHIEYSLFVNMHYFLPLTLIGFGNYFIFEIGNRRQAAHHYHLLSSCPRMRKNNPPSPSVLLTPRTSTTERGRPRRRTRFDGDAKVYVPGVPTFIPSAVPFPEFEAMMCTFVNCSAGPPLSLRDFSLLAQCLPFCFLSAHQNG